MGGASWSGRSLQCCGFRGVFADGAPWMGFPGPGRALLPVFPSFGHVGVVDEACLPGSACCPRASGCTLCSGVRVCWSDSSFVYGFMSLDYGFGTMTATTYNGLSRGHIKFFIYSNCNSVKLHDIQMFFLKLN